MVITPFYSMYHFSDDVDDKGLHFDYHIRPGKATTTNAIRLLDYLGYPKEIVENARGKAAAAKVNVLSNAESVQWQPGNAGP